MPFPYNLEKNLKKGQPDWFQIGIQQGDFEFSKLNVKNSVLATGRNIGVSYCNNLMSELRPSLKLED